MRISLFVLIFIKTVLGNDHEADDLLVNLEQGSLIGTIKSNRLTKKPYYAFLGVPFAKPPIREKRFKDPEEPLPWHGLLNATVESEQCMTYDLIFKNVEGSEDCLYLHIFTPKAPKKLQESPRPVMVWIHGGGFMRGSGRPSDYGPDMMMTQDVVLVNVNYRLNVFGFLSVQNDNVPGNAGLKDQVMALKWVNKNIREFGGDPNKVTIFGESAGGASVHYLVLSPSTKGLFHRAIAQSGVAINPWASTKYILETAHKLGDVFDCNTRNAYELVDCLQQVKAKDLAAFQYNTLSLKISELISKGLNLPCIEPAGTKNGFLTEHPRKIMEEGKFNDVPFILGVVQFETLLLEKLFTEENIPNNLRNLVIETLNSKPQYLLPMNLEVDKEKAKELAKKMKHFYFNDQLISNETIENLINVTSDSWFTLGVHETSVFHAKNGKSPVYLYNFALETEFGESEKPITTDRSGPSHADDLKYFFYLWERNINIKPEELKIILNLNKLWVNFATTGNPTPDESEFGVTWEPFNLESQAYLDIRTNYTLKHYLEKERMEFWDNLTKEENLFYY